MHARYNRRITSVDCIAKIPRITDDDFPDQFSNKALEATRLLCILQAQIVEHELSSKAMKNQTDVLSR